MDELRDWNEERKEKKALRETPPPPMICPWCGQEMEVGTITGGRDSVQWWPGWPNRFFGASGPEIDILHEGSLFNRYKTAWLCRSCRRMVMEIPEEEIPKPLTSEKAAEQLEEQRRREAQRKIDRGLQAEDPSRRRGPAPKRRRAECRIRRYIEREKTDKWHSSISNTGPWVPARPQTP